MPAGLLSRTNSAFLIWWKFNFFESGQDKSVGEIFDAAAVSQKRGSDIPLPGGKVAPYGFVPTVDRRSLPSPVVPDQPLAMLRRGEQVSLAFAVRCSWKYFKRKTLLPE